MDIAFIASIWAYLMHVAPDACRYDVTLHRMSLSE